MPADVARRLIRDAIDDRIFPAAVAEAGNSDGPLWSAVEGRLTFDPASARAVLETPFDLASLTKPIATTSVVMQLIAAEAMTLDEPVAASVAEWRGADRDRVTIRDLLEHAAGLSARLLDPAPNGRREFEHEICSMPLEYAPRSQSIYSDLGFILLGFVAADRAGQSLAAAFASVWTGAFQLAFELPPDVRRQAAPTQPLEEDVRRGRLLVGEVQDNYAAALGGAAGHAGLFGTAPAVGAFARVVLRAARGEFTTAPFTPEIVRRFTTRSSVPGSSRALGWDTMLPASSCGTRMSAIAFGHVGYTGTSLWIDPERNRYFVFLTNRACGGGTVEQMREVRRRFHDALADL